MEPRADDKKPKKSWFQRGTIFDRRKARRRELDGLVAYYWDGGAPAAHPIREISSSGLYLLTNQRWYPGTLVTMTLQKSGVVQTATKGSISVQARVVREGADGVGFAFIAPGNQALQGQPGAHSKADEKQLEEFVRRFIANGGELE